MSNTTYTFRVDGQRFADYAQAFKYADASGQEVEVLDNGTWREVASCEVNEDEN